MIEQQNLEALLRYGIGKRLRFCIKCNDDETALRVKTQVTSGCCTENQKTCNECVYADLKLASILQAEGCAESFCSLCRLFKITSIVLMGDDDPQEFLPDELLAAA